MPKIRLRVTGETHDFVDWTSVAVTRSLDALADSFQLNISTGFRNGQPSMQIEEQDECQILLDDEVVLSGYVDTVDRKYDATSSTLSVTGRSRAGDLCDCTAIHKPWKNTPGLTIASDLCKPFGIAVSSDVGPLPDERYFKLGKSDTVFDVLDRLAREAGLRVVSDPDGSIRFTKTGITRYPDVLIATGYNVITGSMRRSAEERYSNYVFKTQIPSTDDFSGDAAASVKFSVVDDGVLRYRPLVVHVDGRPRNTKGQFVAGVEVHHPLEPQARWELHTRAGKARELVYEIGDPADMEASWRHKHGIWEPNVIVAVRDSEFGIDMELLVKEVVLTLDDRGTRSLATLCHPAAYEPKLPKPGKKKKGGFKF
ncbi:MAG: hypothetical protein JNL82_14490 [Myxococcales bacterium]|nr:hypothetical protein [Myxococcales bacterium]